MKKNPYKLLVNYTKGLIDVNELTDKEKKDLTADIFALNLLVPKEMLISECKKFFVDIDDAQYNNPYIDYLASKFQVDSILIRCQIDSILYGDIREKQKEKQKEKNKKKVLRRENNVLYVDFNKKNSK